VRLLTGRGRFLEDLRLPGMLHARVLRSPYAHARIRRIDTTRASALPGVHAVVDARDVVGRVHPWGHQTQGTPAGERFPFAVDKVLYEGQEVAYDTPTEILTPQSAGNIAVTYSGAAHAARVRVDPGTGRWTVVDYAMAHDSGSVVNPLIVGGQHQGAFLHGFGMVFGEGVVYDDRGRMVNPSFASYLTPYAPDVPDLSKIHEVPAPSTVVHRRLPPPGRRDEPPSPPGRVPRPRRRPVRLLHPGHADRPRRLPGAEPGADRRRGPRGDPRQPLPLHRLPAHRRRGARRRVAPAHDEEDTGMTNPRRQAANPPTVAPPVKPYYSTCVRVTAGPLLFVSGLVPTGVDGDTVGGSDVLAQGRQVFANLRAVLRASGADLGDVVKLTLFVTDMRAFHELTALRTELWPADGPASTLVEVSRLADPRWLIEVEAVAAVP